MHQTKSVKLGDVATYINGRAFKPSDWKETGIPIIRIQNLTNNSKKLNYYQGDLESKYLVVKGDILISWSASLGIYRWDSENAALNQHIFKVVFDKEEIDKKYFFHIVSQTLKKVDSHLHGSTMKHITKGKFDNLIIPLPSLPIQKKIAEVLDKADELRQIKKKTIEKLDQLIQSIFLDMFGDPVTNPKGWETIQLSEIAEVVSGVTKGKKYNDQTLFDYPYLRVANVQDGHLDLSVMKYIQVTRNEGLKFKLLKGDVLFTEGGDPDKLGRGAVWQYEIDNCIHQNHIFRVRLKNDSGVLPLYLSKLAGSVYGKHYFLRASKQTTGIASINSTQLKAFPCYLPPQSLQKDFLQRITEITLYKSKIEESYFQYNNLFNSLMQKAFKGELQFKD